MRLEAGNLKLESPSFKEWLWSYPLSSVLCLLASVLILTSCATVKDNEANLIKVEKSSPAEEANRWADFSGKLIHFVKGQ